MLKLPPSPPFSVSVDVSITSLLPIVVDGHDPDTLSACCRRERTWWYTAGTMSE